jgi:siroheme synthase
VVRLKSGDPFVCARGAEEVAALADRGIRCEVTPGVSAATAVPLAAGPRFARGATVTIASGDRDTDAAPVPWEAVAAQPAGSLVVLTGRSQQGAIADRLQAGGLPGDTPAAVVHSARRPDCRVVVTTLDRLGGTRLPPPAGFVVGPQDSGVGDAHP